MKDHRPFLRIVLALVLLANAGVFAMPALGGESLAAWEIGLVLIMAGLGLAFGYAGLKGLRGAG